VSGIKVVIEYKDSDEGPDTVVEQAFGISMEDALAALDQAKAIVLEMQRAINEEKREEGGGA